MFLQIQGVVSFGSLIQVQGPGLIDKFYFIAYAMKKPQLQVLAEGFRCSDSIAGPDEIVVGILDPRSEQPRFGTSSQVFHQLMSDLKLAAHEVLPKLSFLVHDFRVCPFSPLLKVRAFRASGPYPFSVQVKRAKATAVKLPFGLKPVVRKRKPKQDNEGKKRQKVKREDVQPVAKDCSAETVPAAPAEEFHSHNSDNDAALSDSISSDKSIGSQGDFMSDLDSDSGSDASIDGGVAEQPFLTEEVARDVSEVNTLFQCHRSKIEEAGEIFCERGPPEEETVEGAISSAPPQGLPTSSSASKKSSAPSFCNASLGICNVSVQVASRLARCRHCMDKVAKHEVRFGYAFHKQKFHAYLHGRCVASHLRQEGGNVQQAVEYLQGRMSDEACSAEIVAAVDMVLKELVAQST